MTHELTLGDLILTGNSALSDDDHGFWFEVAADGTEFGSPDAVIAIVQSLLSDGDLLDYSRDGNRSVPVRVKVLGPDLVSVARGEAALRQASKINNELTWQPDDEFAPASVYETFASPMFREYEKWDLDEKMRRERTFRLDLACSPYVRSPEMTTVTALPSGTTTATIDTCDSATGWSGTTSGVAATPSTAWDAGAVGVAELDDAVTSPEVWTLSRAGSVDFSATPYLKVQVRTIASDVGSPMNVTAYASAPADPAQKLTTLSIRSLDDDYFEVIYDATGKGVVPALTFRHVSTPGHPWQGLFVRDVARTDVQPNFTSRQVNRILEVGGTERTPASIRISAPDGTSALGLTFVSTTPSRYPEVGFDPAMSRWYVSGTRTADATTVSGYRFRLDNGFFTSEMPATSVPDGGYQMTSLIKASTPGNYLVESVVQTKQGGVTLAEWSHNEPTPLTTNYLLVDLGVPNLPILRTQSGAEVVLSVRVLDLDGNALVGITVEAQDAWFFPVDDGCGLTILQTDQPFLWLDSPTVATGVQRVWEGDVEDRSGSRFPLSGVHTFGQHYLEAGTTGLMVATSGVEYPDAQTTYYKRWLHNAAE